MDLSTYPTINEQILAMSEEDLEKFAVGRALASADSSRLEGLVLDQELLTKQFLADYRQLRAEHTQASPP